MKNIISLALAISLFAVFMISCGGDDSKPTGSEGGSCYGNGSCNPGLVCNFETNICSATCSYNNKFCHEYNGLNWSDVSNESLNWDAADIECGNIGGRLPTISELRTLVKSCTGTVTGGSCNVTDDCLCYSSSCDCLDGDCFCENQYLEGDLVFEYSVFGDTSFLWSSSETSDMDQHYAWCIDFATAGINTQIKDSLLLFRCVK